MAAEQSRGALIEGEGLPACHINGDTAKCCSHSAALRHGAAAMFAPTPLRRRRDGRRAKCAPGGIYQPHITQVSPWSLAARWLAVTFRLKWTNTDMTLRLKRFPSPRLPSERVLARRAAATRNLSALCLFLLRPSAKTDPWIRHNFGRDWCLHLATIESTM